MTAEVSDSGEVIREMPRTGTGPFPAQRSSFSFPGGQYGFAARGTQFGTSSYSRSYGVPASGQYRASGQYSLGSYHGPVAVPAQAGPARDGPSRPAQWPFQSRLELGALPGAVPCARLHARLVLTEWGQASLGDSVELIVSELMTNALRASTDPVAGRPGYGADGRQQPLGLRLASDRRQVLVEVWDGVTEPPVPGQVSHDGETGRGLLMVEAVSSRWGYYYPARQPPGTAPDERATKVVWALIQPGS
ncbi:MAG TPA: ATP-binding protein [Streptosporangiaceae bacterium]